MGHSLSTLNRIFKEIYGDALDDIFLTPFEKMIKSLHRDGDTYSVVVNHRTYISDNFHDVYIKMSDNTEPK